MTNIIPSRTTLFQINRIIPELHLLRMLFACLASVVMSTGHAAGLSDSKVDFESQIRPLLKQHCVRCHGAANQKSGLRLDARSYFFKGGDSGKVVEAGSAVNSELVRRLRSTDESDRMPPADNPALDAASITVIEEWINEGAEWPETDEDRELQVDHRRNHWAWQPIQNHLLPTAAESRLPAVAQADAPIDAWIQSRLLKDQLPSSDTADRRTLIRRLAFDLTGLPPTPEQVHTFITDESPDAWNQLIEQFLASPHYGERQARLWLDIAHYADTHGFERDQRRDNAWRYRDWVIEAFNSDMPYNQFLMDQVAGDVLRPQDARAVIATGFLAAGPWDFVGQAETPSPVLKRLARADDLDDMITQVMTAACAVTINCARCHDHKLDPITQDEYYGMWAVFSGVKRADRLISDEEEERLQNRRRELSEAIKAASTQLSILRDEGLSLADIVCGGDGYKNGSKEAGIDPLTGNIQKEKRGFLEAAMANHFVPSRVRFVDGVVIPNGGSSPIPISSTGLTVEGIPSTSARAWDAIRSGPVNSHFSTTLDGIDFNTDAHQLLSLHANAAITFDLNALRQYHKFRTFRLHGSAGYFGQTPRAGASVHILLDGEIKFETLNIGRDDGLQSFDLAIPDTVRFLTLMATDGGNEISHDQIGFADTYLSTETDASKGVDQQREAEYVREIKSLQEELSRLPESARVYAIVTEQPPEVRVLLRGNPEQSDRVVAPTAISCIDELESTLSSVSATDAERRTAFAHWLTNSKNPLTRRVIVNRIWQQHFGVGIVDTPSDFGLGGSLPTHPELLDWLADELLRSGWSLKHIHRLICQSAAYRQTSVKPNSDDRRSQIDESNRLLWRQNARRLDAEALRDAVLSVSGCLNPEMYGPGYRDFEYQEEYAPIYRYITADRKELWRRSVYRFIVRTTPDQFMTTLDCPNPANLTPTRNVTTTALQSLAMLNNEFMLRQSRHFAERLRQECEEDRTAQIQRAFQLCFGREPDAAEVMAADELIVSSSLSEFCLQLLNASEFVYVD